MRIPIRTAVELAERTSLRILPEGEIALAQTLRQHGFHGLESRAVRHADLPSGVLIRCKALEARPQSLLSAPISPCTRCMCAMEVGIPASWCASLPPNRHGNRIYRQIMAIGSLGYSRWKWITRALASWNASPACKE